MNKRGHKQTLIPAQPGNTNALRSGVYSEAARAPRVAELNAELAGHPADEVAEETLRGNLNSLTATREAMDQELAKSLVGRRGEPRTLLDHYLRLTDKIMRNAVALAAVSERRQPAIAPPAIEAKPEDEPQEALHDAVARAHYRHTLAEVSPDYFDPPTFLLCVADSGDPAVTFGNQRAASKLLTRIERAEYCTCRTTLTARDGIEMRDWIDMWREHRDSFEEGDRYVAGLVREIAAGRTRDLYPLHNLMIDAVEAVEAVERDATADPEAGHARRRPRVRPERRVARFWQTLLSPDPDVEPTVRLQALAALDEAGALARCTCPKVATTELVEERADRTRAFVVRMVAQNNHHAAEVIARFPETALAVRDIVDETLVSAATIEPKELEE